MGQHIRLFTGLAIAAAFEDASGEGVSWEKDARRELGNPPIFGLAEAQHGRREIIMELTHAVTVAEFLGRGKRIM